MSAELLPCPFCGNDGVFLDNYRNRWTVGCQNMGCGAFSGFYQVHDNQQIAASLWNTRTPDLSFLDKAEVVEVAYQALKGEWTYFPTTEDEWKTAIETAIAAIKRMAKEDA